VHALKSAPKGQFHRRFELDVECQEWRSFVATSSSSDGGRFFCRVMETPTRLDATAAGPHDGSRRRRRPPMLISPLPLPLFPGPEEGAEQQGQPAKRSGRRWSLPFPSARLKRGGTRARRRNSSSPPEKGSSAERRYGSLSPDAASDATYISRGHSGAGGRAGGRPACSPRLCPSARLFKDQCPTVQC